MMSHERNHLGIFTQYICDLCNQCRMGSPCCGPRYTRWVRRSNHLEQWKAGTEEPPHSHSGDDMTVVVEGKMSVQFYIREGDRLVVDGERIYLNQGETGYIKGGRIHDAKYIGDCKLVYVHNKAFAFQAA